MELEKKFEDLSGSTRKKVKQIKKYFKFTLTPGTPTLPERAPPNDYRMHWTSGRIILPFNISGITATASRIPVSSDRNAGYNIITILDLQNDAHP